MKKTYISIFVSLCFSIIFSACTNLDETLYDRISATNFYKTPEEVNAGLTDVYYRFNVAHNFLNQWQLQECSTDHAMCPWGDGNVFKQAQLHTWDATHGPMREVYTNIFSCIAACNSFIETLKLAKLSNGPAIEAEVKTIRAYSYMELIDLFGNVPIVTVAQIDPQNLPTNKPIVDQRKKVFEFIEAELKDAILNLVSLKDVADKQGYYPRVAKETAQSLLAKLYLNAEIWSGTARWQDCANACDDVINSDVYSLPTIYGGIWKAFAPDNEIAANNKEIILGLSKENIANWDPATGNWINTLSIHPELKGAWRNGKNLNITYAGWGGPSVLDEHFMIYDSLDFRRTLILKGKFYDQNNKLLIDIKPYSNTDIFAFNNPKEGLSCIKYQPDPTVLTNFARNDMILLRYADILLSKAEAIYRLSPGNKSTAEALITQVYARNFQIPRTFTINSLDDILQERSREFLWENTYRTDLVRFGKFITTRTKWKTTDDPAYRNIFPIPQSEMQTNPNLSQNPNY